MQTPQPPEFDPDEDHFGLEEEHRSSLSSGRYRPLAVVRQLWNPQPLPKPTIDPELRSLDWPERSAEVLRFTILSVEHWLSQGGVLREWLRLNLWFAVVFTAAAILIIPPVTAIMEGAVEFTGLLGNIVENMTSSVMKLPPVVLALATLFVLFRFLLRQWRKRRAQQGYGQNSGFDDYHQPFN